MSTTGVSSTAPAATPTRRARRFRDGLVRLAASPNDDESTRLQKVLLVGAALMMSLGGIGWGLFLMAFDEATASTIPFAYTALTIVNVAVYRVGRRYRLFRAVQLLLTLLLPFFLLIALGGLRASGAVVAWSLLAPLGALMCCTPRQATYWFVAFGGVLVASAFLESVLDGSNHLPAPVLTIFTIMNVGVPTLAAFILVHYFVQQKNAALSALATEQAKSERLLLNVLPAEIAQVLKNGEATVAESFESVTIMFADVVGFTALSAQMSPEAMVAALNEIFSEFDRLSSHYQVEKIRTIGDNYMAVAGAPVRRPDHARAIVEMAVDMMDYLRRREDIAGAGLQFRIGINTGQAVGAVIGNHKFHYDLWGDAVNVASRMESHGLPGRIQIGPATHALVQDDFECEPRGILELKGKGSMEAWLVVGRRPSDERDARPAAGNAAQP